ncbi:MAG: radical SAM protein [Planctomycetota bacterium]|jgi:wyosine [tRNA(Phe)-imidazoG37] synthetase (radical SAM superfamily)
MSSKVPLRQYQDHSRSWRDNLYVYPVISRRSGGLSIGVNLNPDTACNFDCIYCQVDRTAEPRTRDVDVSVMADELEEMIQLASTGQLYRDEAFADVPEQLRAIRDIAFSGDGEPTTCKVFYECVETAARLKASAGCGDVRMVLITDAAYLVKPEVKRALEIFDNNNGEIWAKLDAGTEAYFQRVNIPNTTLDHVIENITDAARKRPVVIQSMFMRVDGRPPDEQEINAYLQRLSHVLENGGRISYVQVYTVARRPAQSIVTALSRQELDEIVACVRNIPLAAEPYYGSEF